VPWVEWPDRASPSCHACDIMKRTMGRRVKPKKITVVSMGKIVKAWLIAPFDHDGLKGWEWSGSKGGTLWSGGDRGAVYDRNLAIDWCYGWEGETVDALRAVRAIS
jgi:hypothetical protein